MIGKEERERKREDWINGKGYAENKSICRRAAILATCGRFRTEL